MTSPLLRSGPRAMPAIASMIRGPVVQQQHEGVHFITKSRLGRGKRHRWDMLKNMATSLIEHERILTTVHKAKELRRLADRLVTCAKQGTVQGRKNAAGFVRTKDMLTKLFTSARAALCKPPAPLAPI